MQEFSLIIFETVSQTVYQTVWETVSQTVSQTVSSWVWSILSTILRSNDYLITCPGHRPDPGPGRLSMSTLSQI